MEIPEYLKEMDNRVKDLYRANMDISKVEGLEQVRDLSELGQGIEVLIVGEERFQEIRIKERKASAPGKVVVTKGVFAEGSYNANEEPEPLTFGRCHHFPTTIKKHPLPITLPGFPNEYKVTQEQIEQGRVYRLRVPADEVEEAIAETVPNSKGNTMIENLNVTVVKDSVVNRSNLAPQ